MACRWWASLRTRVRPRVQLAAVHLVDSSSCSDPAKFLAVALLSLITMVRLEMPHVNLLSKVDAIEAFGELGACVCGWLGKPAAGGAHNPAQGGRTRDHVTLQSLVWTSLPMC